VRVSAPGYVTRSLQVFFTKDLVLDVGLEKASAAGAQGRGGGADRPTASAGAPPAPAPGPTRRALDPGDPWSP